jgi:hypothetical protein
MSAALSTFEIISYVKKPGEPGDGGRVKTGGPTVVRDRTFSTSETSVFAPEILGAGSDEMGCPVVQSQLDSGRRVEVDAGQKKVCLKVRASAHGCL